MLLKGCLALSCKILLILAISASILKGIIGITSGFRKTTTCQDVLSQGRWSHDSSRKSEDASWTPYGCILQRLDPQTSQECLRRHNLTFIGDSTSRQLFWAFARKLNETLAEVYQQSAPKHADIHVALGEGVHLDFEWDPYLNLTKHNMTQHFHHISTDTGVRTWILGGGLWHARNLGTNAVERFGLDLKQTMERFHEKEDLIVILPLVIPEVGKLSPERHATLTPEMVGRLNEQIMKQAADKAIPVFWTISNMLSHRPDMLDTDGLHVSKHAAAIQAEILLHNICQGTDAGGSSNAFTCCSDAAYPKTMQVIFLTVAAVISVQWTVRSLLTTILTFQNARDQKSSNSKMNSLGIISTILVYCYVSDRTQILQHSARITDQNLFLMIVVICLLAGGLTIKHSVSQRNSKLALASSAHTGYLSRDQTDEWKGWMQLVILLYHFFGLSKVLWTYQLARCLVSAYLFMTGYGHGLYLLRTQDFSIRRVFSVLLRLNILPCMLTFVMDNPYDLYYFPGLSSFWFVVTWLTLFRINNSNNIMRQVLIRVTISFGMVKLFLTHTGCIETISRNLANLEIIDFQPQEFRFRVGLDILIPYIGVLVAAVTALKDRIDEKGSQRIWVVSNHQRMWTLSIICIASTAIFCFIGCCWTFEDKYRYNLWHPYLSPVPVLAFVALRNSTPGLRRRFSKAFARLGRCSLETYVLQYHIWLAADAKGLLRLGLLDIPALGGRTIVSSWSFWSETVIISMIFLWCSELLSYATTHVVHAIILDDGTGKRNASTLPFRTRRMDDPKTWRDSLFRIGVGGRMAILFLVLWSINLVGTP